MKTHIKSKKIATFKKLLLIAFFLLIFVVASVFILEKLNITNFINNQNYKTKTEIESITNSNPKIEDQKNVVDTQKSATENQTKSGDFSVSIVTIDNSEGYIKIKSIINGVVSNSGSCELTVTKDTNTITQTSETYAMTSYSTCKGFEVDSSKMDSGLWEVKLSVSINGKISSAIKSYTL